MNIDIDYTEADEARPASYDPDIDTMTIEELEREVDRVEEEIMRILSTLAADHQQDQRRQS